MEACLETEACSSEEVRMLEVSHREEECLKLEACLEMEASLEEVRILVALSEEDPAGSLAVKRKSAGQATAAPHRSAHAAR